MEEVFGIPSDEILGGPVEPINWDSIPKIYKPYAERAPRLLIHGWPRRVRRPIWLPALINLAYWTDEPGEMSRRRFLNSKRRPKPLSYVGECRKRMAHTHHMRTEVWKPHQRHKFSNWPGFKDIKRRIMPKQEHFGP